MGILETTGQSLDMLNKTQILELFEQRARDHEIEEIYTYEQFIDLANLLHSLREEVVPIRFMLFDRNKFLQVCDRLLDKFETISIEIIDAYLFNDCRKMF